MKDKVQYYIQILAHEENGIWDLITDLVNTINVSRAEAFQLLKNEIDFLIERDDIYFLTSKKLYDTETSSVVDKKELLNLSLDDVEFNEDGPFYYLSFADEI